MKVMIIGGCGFLGAFLAQKLLLERIRVTIVDAVDQANLPQQLLQETENGLLDYHQCDLTSADTLDLLPNDCTHIVHLAAILGVQNVLNNPAQTLEQNMLLTKNALYVGARQRALEQFMFASTSEVYAGSVAGQIAGVPTAETSPILLPEISNPRTTYMLSKMYGEAMMHHANFPTICIRPHNIYGPRMGFRHVIPQLYTRMTSGSEREIDVYSPSHTRSFCFIDDAIEMLWRLFSIETGDNLTINIGTENAEIAMLDLAQKIHNFTNSDVVLVSGENTTGSPVRRAPDMSLCKTLIDYESQIGIDEGLNLTLTWYQGLKQSQSTNQ